MLKLRTVLLRFLVSLVPYRHASRLIIALPLPHSWCITSGQFEPGDEGTLLKWLLDELYGSVPSESHGRVDQQARVWWMRCVLAEVCLEMRTSGVAESLLHWNTFLKMSPRVISSCLAGSHMWSPRKFSWSEQPSKGISASTWNNGDFRIC